MAPIARWRKSAQPSLPAVIRPARSPSDRHGSSLGRAAAGGSRARRARPLLGRDFVLVGEPRLDVGPATFAHLEKATSFAYPEPWAAKCLKRASREA